MMLYCIVHGLLKVGFYDHDSEDHDLMNCLYFIRFLVNTPGVVLAFEYKNNILAH